MPELPEVETVKRDLAQHLAGKGITAVCIANGSCIKCPEQEGFIAALCGRSFKGFDRRGKFLRLILDDDSILTVHLRMTGRLIYTPADMPKREHTHIIFSLSDGAELRYSDTRRFGCLWWQAASEQDCTGMSRLGLEPFDDGFGGQYLLEKLGKRVMPIKSAILDQQIVAGLGNIYADEVLFLSHINPQTPCNRLKVADWELLAAQMQAVLNDAIANRGTTFSDFLDGEGHIGANQHFLRVYGKKHQPCPDCQSLLEYTKVGGRGTVFCPKCQK